MAKRPDHFSFEDYERRRLSQAVPIRDWLLGPDPDPTYDRLNGWKLDQFAMAFVPDLMRKYKSDLAKIRCPTFPRESSEWETPYAWLERGRTLNAEIMRRLLNARFKVKGYELQNYTPMVIPVALLQRLKPDTVTSEFCERYVPPETARRFEHVRVFDLEPTVKSSAGRPPTYDWQKLAERLEKEKPVLTTDAALRAYCRKNVTGAAGMRANIDGPDDKTIRDAISRYELKKFMSPA